MANISISQMDTRAVANLSDLFEVAYADEQSSTGYASGKMSAEVIANGIVNSYTYTSAMPNMGNRTIAGAMNTMLEGFAPAYDDTQTYVVGDYCTYAGKMYICSTAVSTAGAWDSTKWTETTCAEEFGTDVVVDNTLSTTSENPVQNKVITQNINSINANLVSEKTTAKADIVSITDAQDIPAENVKADIEPVQDLHGYEYPWVGGAGKNKLIFYLTNIKGWNTNGTWNGNIYTQNNTIIEVLIDSGNNITGFKVNTNSTVSSTFVFWLISTSTDVYANNNYILSGCPSGGSGSTYALRIYRNGNTYAEDTGSGANVSGATGLQFGLVFFSGTTLSNKTFYPMLRLSTVTDPTFAPYSNICPISGYDECEVTRTGKNLFDEIYTNISDTLIYRAIAVPNGTYTMSTSVPYNPNGLATLFLLAGNVSSGASSIVNGVDMYTSRTVTATDGYITVAYRTVNNGAINPANYQTQIEKGTRATAYEPYQGQTYTVSFVDSQDNPMTVYSGQLDVTTGVLTVDKKLVKYQDLTWTYANSKFSTAPSDIKNSCDLITSNYYFCGRQNVNNTNPTVDKAIGTWGTFIVLKDSDITSLTAFDNAMYDQQIVYELATPQVIQLSPTQIDMLLNNNVISASTGKIQVKYQPANVIGELKKLIYQLTNQ